MGDALLTYLGDYHSYHHLTLDMVISFTEVRPMCIGVSQLATPVIQQRRFLNCRYVSAVSLDGSLAIQSLKT